MTDKQFNILWADSLESTDRDYYVAEWATSSVWGEPADLTDADLLEIAAKLDNLWAVAHMSVKDICKAANLTQVALAIKFCIPIRTVEDWCRGIRQVPHYIRLMMAESLGLIAR